MADPRGFLKFKRQTPPYVPIEERVKNWREFQVPLLEDVMRNQGGRCMDCGVPFCQSPQGCPVENLIPEWNDMVHRGRWTEALKLLHLKNNFPEFTGKLCPAPCETACVLGVIDAPVSIRAIELSIVDRGFEEGWIKPVAAPTQTGKRVAIVGSGPAGLAAAQQLARAGHSVTVYEKADRLGGLLRYGIPDFKMEKTVLDRRLDQLRAEGVKFITSAQVGAPGLPGLGKHAGHFVDARALVDEFDAVCLTTGAEQARDLPIPGRELQGIHFAMDYLIQANRHVAGDREPGDPISALGKNVVILGGGDTGSDCLGTAHRQGCLEAHQFELLPMPPATRDASTPWPAWPLQLRTSHAHEEGCDRRWGYMTTRFVGEDGRIRAVQGHRVVPGATRGTFEPVPGSDFEIQADLVLIAMGFTGPARNGPIESLGLQTDSRGNIQVNAVYRTSVDKVYAAGDAKRGASLIVWAISEGRKMAAAVNQVLSG